MRTLPTFATLSTVARQSTGSGNSSRTSAAEAEGIGMRLRLARKLARLTQADLGAVIGRGPDAIGGYERGERRIPVEVVGLVCQELGVDAPWLISGEGQGPETSSGAAAQPESPVTRHALPGLRSSQVDSSFTDAAVAQIPVPLATQWVICPHCSAKEMRRRELPDHFRSGECVDTFDGHDLAAMTMRAVVDPEPWEAAVARCRSKVEQYSAQLNEGDLKGAQRKSAIATLEVYQQVLDTLYVGGPANYRELYKPNSAT